MIVTFVRLAWNHEIRYCVNAQVSSVRLSHGSMHRRARCTIGSPHHWSPPSLVRSRRRRLSVGGASVDGQPRARSFGVSEKCRGGRHQCIYPRQLRWEISVSYFVIIKKATLLVPHARQSASEVWTERVDVRVGCFGFFEIGGQWRVSIMRRRSLLRYLAWTFTSDTMWIS